MKLPAFALLVLALAACAPSYAPVAYVPARVPAAVTPTPNYAAMPPELAAQAVAAQATLAAAEAQRVVIAQQVAIATANAQATDAELLRAQQSTAQAVAYQQTAIAQQATARAVELAHAVAVQAVTDAAEDRATARSHAAQGTAEAKQAAQATQARASALQAIADQEADKARARGEAWASAVSILSLAVVIGACVAIALVLRGLAQWIDAMIERKRVMDTRYGGTLVLAAPGGGWRPALAPELPALTGDPDGGDYGASDAGDAEPLKMTDRSGTRYVPRKNPAYTAAQHALGRLLRMSIEVHPLHSAGERIVTAEMAEQMGLNRDAWRDGRQAGDRYLRASNAGTFVKPSGRDGEDYATLGELLEANARGKLDLDLTRFQPAPAPAEGSPARAQA